MRKSIEDLVTTFFRNHAGTILRQAGASPDSSQEVKQTLLDHYEQIFPAFAQEAPYALMRLTYADASEAEQALRQRFGAQSPDPMELLRTACRTEENFLYLTEAYRRCFNCLLTGRLP